MSIGRRLLFMVAAAFHHRAKDELLTVGGLHGRGLIKKYMSYGNCLFI